MRFSAIRCDGCKATNIKNGKFELEERWFIEMKIGKETYDLCDNCFLKALALVRPEEKKIK